MPGDPAVRERADRGRQPPNGLTDLHLDASSGSSLAHAERWGAALGVPSLAHAEPTARAGVARRGRRLPRDLVLDEQRWAAEIGVPSYALDEQTALAVVDGSVEVVSEGRWRHVEA